MNCREKVGLESGSEAKSCRIIAHTEDLTFDLICAILHICENRKKTKTVTIWSMVEGKSSF